MKIPTFVLAVSLSASGIALAAEMAGHDMAGMKMDAPAASQTYKGVGVVKGIDIEKGSVTLAHEPVPALKWPAMQMPFVISPEMAKGVQVGQRVNFEFSAKGMNGTITKIEIAK